MSVGRSYRSLGDHLITWRSLDFGTLYLLISRMKEPSTFIALLKTHLFKLAFPSYIVIHDIVFIYAY